MIFEQMRRIGICAFVFLVVAVQGQWGGARELKKVRFGYPSLGFRQGHIWVAKDEGLFKNMVSMWNRSSFAVDNSRSKPWQAATLL